MVEFSIFIIVIQKNYRRQTFTSPLPTYNMCKLDYIMMDVYFQELLDDGTAEAGT